MTEQSTEQTEPKRKRHAPPTCDQTADEFFESLNGFDEIAVQQKFGRKPIELSEVDAMAFARALVFVNERRGGLKDAEAHKAAMECTIRQVNDYFADGEDEPMPDEPVTESGKGDGPSATPPTS